LTQTPGAVSRWVERTKGREGRVFGLRLQRCCVWRITNTQCVTTTRDNLAAAKGLAAETQAATHRHTRGWQKRERGGEKGGKRGGARGHKKGKLNIGGNRKGCCRCS